MFALQFARAAGAVLIATTSMDEKCKLLKKHGVTHVINYSRNPSWAQMAKDLTPEGKGVDFVVEVGGATTMRQSLQTIGRDATIAVVGYLSWASEHEATLYNALTYQCNTQGIVVGNRVMFAELVRAIEADDIQPVVDTRVFKLKQAKEAYQVTCGTHDQGIFSRLA
jgi:NADPH:quinone reductase-like Zn-dependent oxidoreductase